MTDTTKYFDWVVEMMSGAAHEVAGIMYFDENEVHIRGNNGELNFWAPKSHIANVVRQGHPDRAEIEKSVPHSEIPGECWCAK